MKNKIVVLIFVFYINKLNLFVFIPFCILVYFSITLYLLDRFTSEL